MASIYSFLRDNRELCTAKDRTHHGSYYFVAVQQASLLESDAGRDVRSQLMRLARVTEAVSVMKSLGTERTCEKNMAAFAIVPPVVQCGGPGVLSDARLREQAAALQHVPWGCAVDAFESMLFAVGSAPLDASAHTQRGAAVENVHVSTLVQASPFIACGTGGGAWWMMARFDPCADEPVIDFGVLDVDELDLDDESGDVAPAYKRQRAVVRGYAIPRASFAQVWYRAPHARQPTTVADVTLPLRHGDTRSTDLSSHLRASSDVPWFGTSFGKMLSERLVGDALHRVMSTKGAGVLEMLSNAIDASSHAMNLGATEYSIGRFGMGFFAVLRMMYGAADSGGDGHVTVFSAYRARGSVDYEYLATISPRRKNDLVVDIPVVHREVSAGGDRRGRVALMGTGTLVALHAYSLKHARTVPVCGKYLYASPMSRWALHNVQPEDDADYEYGTLLRGAIEGGGAELATAFKTDFVEECLQSLFKSRYIVGVPVVLTSTGSLLARVAADDVVDEILAPRRVVPLDVDPSVLLSGRDLYVPGRPALSDAVDYWLPAHLMNATNGKVVYVMPERVFAHYALPSQCVVAMERGLPIGDALGRAAALVYETECSRVARDREDTTRRFYERSEVRAPTPPFVVSAYRFWHDCEARASSADLGIWPGATRRVYMRVAIHVPQRGVHFVYRGRCVLAFVHEGFRDRPWNVLFAAPDGSARCHALGNPRDVHKSLRLVSTMSSVAHRVDNKAQADKLCERAVAIGWADLCQKYKDACCGPPSRPCLALDAMRAVRGLGITDAFARNLVTSSILKSVVQVQKHGRQATDRMTTVTLTSQTVSVQDHGEGISMNDLLKYALIPGSSSKRMQSPDNVLTSPAGGVSVTLVPNEPISPQCPGVSLYPLVCHDMSVATGNPLDDYVLELWSPEKAAGALSPGEREALKEEFLYESALVAELTLRWRRVYETARLGPRVTRELLRERMRDEGAGSTRDDDVGQAASAAPGGVISVLAMSGVVLMDMDERSTDARVKAQLRECMPPHDESVQRGTVVVSCPSSWRLPTSRTDVIMTPQQVFFMSQALSEFVVSHAASITPGVAAAGDDDAQRVAWYAARVLQFASSYAAKTESSLAKDNLVAAVVRITGESVLRGREIVPLPVRTCKRIRNLLGGLQAAHIRSQRSQPRDVAQGGRRQDSPSPYDAVSLSKRFVALPWQFVQGLYNQMPFVLGPGSFLEDFTIGVVSVFYVFYGRDTLGEEGTSPSDAVTMGLSNVVFVPVGRTNEHVVEVVRAVKSDDTLRSQTERVQAAIRRFGAHAHVSENSAVVAELARHAAWISEAPETRAAYCRLPAARVVDEDNTCMRPRDVPASYVPVSGAAISTQDHTADVLEVARELQPARVGPESKSARDVAIMLTDMLKRIITVDDPRQVQTRTPPIAWARWGKLRDPPPADRERNAAYVALYRDLNTIVPHMDNIMTATSQWDYAVRALCAFEACTDSEKTYSAQGLYMGVSCDQAREFSSNVMRCMEENAPSTSKLEADVVSMLAETYFETLSDEGGALRTALRRAMRYRDLAIHMTHPMVLTVRQCTGAVSSGEIDEAARERAIALFPSATSWSPLAVIANLTLRSPARPRDFCSRFRTLAYTCKGCNTYKQATVLMTAMDALHDQYSDHQLGQLLHAEHVTATTRSLCQNLNARVVDAIHDKVYAFSLSQRPDRSSSTHVLDYARRLILEEDEGHLYSSLVRCLVYPTRPAHSVRAEVPLPKGPVFSVRDWVKTLLVCDRAASSVRALSLRNTPDLAVYRRSYVHEWLEQLRDKRIFDAIMYMSGYLDKNALRCIYADKTRPLVTASDMYAYARQRARSGQRAEVREFLSSLARVAEGAVPLLPQIVSLATALTERDVSQSVMIELTSSAISALRSDASWRSSLRAGECPVNVSWELRRASEGKVALCVSVVHPVGLELNDLLLRTLVPFSGTGGVGAAEDTHELAQGELATGITGAGIYTLFDELCERVEIRTRPSWVSRKGEVVHSHDSARVVAAPVALPGARTNMHDVDFSISSLAQDEWKQNGTRTTYYTVPIPVGLACARVMNMAVFTSQVLFMANCNGDLVQFDGQEPVPHTQFTTVVAAPGNWQVLPSTGMRPHAEGTTVCEWDSPDAQRVLSQLMVDGIPVRELCVWIRDVGGSCALSEFMRYGWVVDVARSILPPMHNLSSASVDRERALPVLNACAQAVAYKCAMRSSPAPPSPPHPLQGYDSRSRSRPGFPALVPPTESIACRAGVDRGGCSIGDSWDVAISARFDTLSDARASMKMPADEGRDAATPMSLAQIMIGLFRMLDTGRARPERGGFPASAAETEPLWDRHAEGLELADDVVAAGAIVESSAAVVQHAHVFNRLADERGLDDADCRKAALNVASWIVETVTRSSGIEVQRMFALCMVLSATTEHGAAQSAGSAFELLRSRQYEQHPVSFLLACWIAAHCLVIHSLSEDVEAANAAMTRCVEYVRRHATQVAQQHSMLVSVPSNAERAEAIVLTLAWGHIARTTAPCIRRDDVYLSAESIGLAKGRAARMILDKDARDIADFERSREIRTLLTSVVTVIKNAAALVLSRLCTSVQYAGTETRQLVAQVVERQAKDIADEFVKIGYVNVLSETDIRKRITLLLSDEPEREQIAVFSDDPTVEVPVIASVVTRADGVEYLKQHRDHLLYVNIPHDTVAELCQVCAGETQDVRALVEDVSATVFSKPLHITPRDLTTPNSAIQWMRFGHLQRFIGDVFLPNMCGLSALNVADSVWVQNKAHELMAARHATHQGSERDFANALQQARDIVKDAVSNRIMRTIPFSVLLKVDDDLRRVLELNNLLSREG